MNKFTKAALAVVATGLVSLFAVAGCGGDAKVNVDCKGEAEGVRCDVHHTEGSATVEACWDIVFECENGKKPQGHGCKVVAPGKTESEMIPKDKVTSWDDCDKAKSATVSNMKLTIK